MPRPRKNTVFRRFYADLEQIDTVTEIAKNLGYIRDDKGSISLLIQAIADGEILIFKKALTK
jgi:hypothetical protein